MDRTGLDKNRLEEMCHEAAIFASGALSKLCGGKVSLDVSKVEITDIRKKFVINPEDMVAGVYLPITGNINGATLLVFPEEIAYALADVLVKRPPGSSRALTELDKSALKEVGNIVCGSFLTVFSNTLKIKIVENIPEFSFDMFGAVADIIIAGFSKNEEESLILEVKFVFEQTAIKGYIVLVFGIEDMNKIMNALSVNK